MVPTASSSNRRTTLAVHHDDRDGNPRRRRRAESSIAIELAQISPFITKKPWVYRRSPSSDTYTSS
jgi:hypothetical protein